MIAAFPPPFWQASTLSAKLTSAALDQADRCLWRAVQAAVP
jgi:hypothetical protein